MESCSVNLKKLEVKVFKDKPDFIEIQRKVDIMHQRAQEYY